jgi:hypothetical protein
MAKRRKKAKPSEADLNELAHHYDNDSERSGPPAMLPPFAIARGFINPPEKKRSKSDSTDKEERSDSE